MKNAVIDLETLGIRTNSVILSVGITIFDDTQVDTFQHLLDNSINIFLEQDPQTHAGRTVLKSTLVWWEDKGMSRAAWREVPNQIHPKDLNAHIDKFLEPYNLNRRKLKWYCRGPHFDISKIEDLCADFECNTPWHYRSPRDVRTFYDEHGYDDDVRFQRPENMIPHNAAHDAAAEAYWMQRLSNSIDPVVVKSK